MGRSPNVGTSGRYSVSDFVSVVADAQTYKNLLYLVLAFPLGMFYYVILVVGFVLGVGLSVLLVGLGILLGTAIGLRHVASFERKLANVLLGTAIAAPDDIEKSGGGAVATVTAYLQAPSTWRGVGFVLLKFWLGVLSFVLLVSLLGVAVELLLLPLFPGGVFNVEVSGWRVARNVGSATGRAVAVPVGAVLALVALHVLNAFAGANASIASSLLGPEESDSVEGTASGSESEEPA